MQDLQGDLQNNNKQHKTIRNVCCDYVFTVDYLYILHL